VASLASLLKWGTEDLLALLGHIKTHAMKMDTRTQIAMGIFSQFEADTAERAVGILELLLEQQNREGNKR